MKKFFTIFFILAALTSLSLAQMQIGPKAGLNIASIGGDDADQILEGQSLDSKTGFSGGLFFMYQFSNMFAIQPEAYYTMKGATYSESGADLTISLDYIEVPLLFKLLIPIEGSNIKPSIFAGPSIGFNMTAKSKVSLKVNQKKMILKMRQHQLNFLWHSVAAWVLWLVKMNLVLM